MNYKNSKEVMEDIGVEKFDYLTRISVTTLGHAYLYLAKLGLWEDFTKEFPNKVKLVLGSMIEVVKNKEELIKK